MSHSLVLYNLIFSYNYILSAASHEQRFAFLSLRCHYGSFFSERTPLRSCHFETFSTSAYLLEGYKFIEFFMLLI